MIGQGKGLTVKVNSSNNEDVIIENAYSYDCFNVEEAMKYYQLGLSNKTVASHRMNEASSRAHSILTFTVLQQDLSRDYTAAHINSRFRLVDLAGSERQSKTVEPGQATSEVQFKEAVEINKSLFALRQVITALTENSKRAADSS